MVGCGAIIDMRSGIGTIVIPGTNNSGPTTITTGPQTTGHPYVDVRIPDGGVCEIRGYAALLLYCHAVPNPPPPVRLSPVRPREIRASELSATRSTLEVQVRIQITTSGKFSLPYHKDILRASVTSEEFFDWFQNELNNVRRSNPAQNNKPAPRLANQLCFTLKDAMPVPKAGILCRGDDALFTHMRKYIKAQYEKTKVFCPGLKEFGILVSVPGELLPDASDDEW